MRRAWRAQAGAAPLLIVLLTAMAAVAGQAVGAQHTRSVTGVVQRDDGGAPRPVAGLWIVLHRVGQDTAAAIDSARSDGRGRYAFRYAARGDSAVYFVSASYGGVAYFTPPFRDGDTPSDGAALTVYDTTSAGATVLTRERHVIVSVIDATGFRSIVEVYELENASARTRVSSARAPSWTTLLPAGAADVRIEQGDVSPDAVVTHDGRVDVFAPVPPGLRQIAFSYTIPASDFPVTLPVADSTTVLEVLIEDPAGRGEGAGLVPEQPVTLHGRTFQRFVARGVVSGATFQVSAPASRPRSGRWMVAVIVVVALLTLVLGVMRAAVGPGGLRAGVRRSHDERADTNRAEALARAIAALDAKFERITNPHEDERTAYAAERDALTQDLTAVLAERDERL